MTPILSVKDLHVAFTTYGRTSEVLKGVSLEVPQGAQVALVGESGSGKSVTMKTIMDLLPKSAKVTSGAVIYEGQDLFSMPKRARLALRGTSMSMVFQDPMSSLNPVFTIKDQLTTILKYADKRLGRGRSAQERLLRVLEVLEKVRMRDPERVAASYPVMLSGGMRQRILIAMALLSEPKLLIADEPGTALDVTTQAQILNLLKDLVTEQNLSLLMITHNLGVVRETSEYVYVMNKGQIVEEGQTAQIFAAPRADYTRDLIAAVPKLTGRSQEASA